MLHNLQAEMARKNLKNKEVADSIKVDVKTLNNKISGRTRFFVNEALAIRDSFFPGMTFEYLFEEDSTRGEERQNE